jgi:hypothetical protein
MNCEQFRTIVGAEPDSTDPDVLAHVEHCPDCARYREEMQAMDRLIYRALAIETPAEKTTEQVLSPPQPRAPRLWRMAATVLLTVLAGMMALWLLTPRESFAEAAITHMRHEQASMVRTSETVDDTRLEQILAARPRRSNAKRSTRMACRE